MTTCHRPPAPNDRAMLRNRLGTGLVQRFGKRTSYTSRQVLDTLGSMPYIPFDWYCWGMATYMTLVDFDAYHRSIGEACDWSAMHGVITEAATTAGGGAWSVTDLVPDLSSLGDLVPDLSSIGDLAP